MKITRTDAYRILSVSEDATTDEIRNSYKRLALKWHPDKHGVSQISKEDATKKFQEVSAAYKRLTTPDSELVDEISDSDFMNVREMMELFAHMFFHNGSHGTCPHHGDCCDYEDEYFYSDDDDDYYYSDEESDDELLDTIANRLRNKYEARKYMAKDESPPQRRVTEEEALRNARELIEAEEREKNRDEKRRTKRKKKKGKKKQKDKGKDNVDDPKDTDKLAEQKPEKLTKSDKENSDPSVVSTQSQNGYHSAASDRRLDAKPPFSPNITVVSVESCQPKKFRPDQTKVGSPVVQANGTTPGRNIPKPPKGELGTPPTGEESIDTNSAFFARAASKAPLVPPAQQNGHAQAASQANTGAARSKATPHASSRNNESALDSPERKQTSKVEVAPTGSNIGHLSRHGEAAHRLASDPKESSAKVARDDTAGVEQTILESRRMANKGNEMAQKGNYVEAVNFFTEAIRLDSSDFRFFGNRSYCYDRMELYQKALDDADAAIRLALNWPKGYFRKGRALTGLQRFQEAEQVFQQVLKLDPACDDAQFELARVRVQILVDMGFSQTMSEQAVRMYGTVQQALEALLDRKVNEDADCEDIYYSDNDEQDVQQQPEGYSQHARSYSLQSSGYSQQTGVKKLVTVVKSDPVQRPVDVKCKTIWVGNVDSQLVTEKQLQQLFAKCGKVSSVKILPQKFCEKSCAFVNFETSVGAAQAMDKLQGYALGNQKLLLRYPNNPPPGSVLPDAVNLKASRPYTTSGSLSLASNSKRHSLSESSEEKLSGPVNGNECYFWRTTGCAFESQCRYKHVRGNKGVDLPKVRAKYGKLLS